MFSQCPRWYFPSLVSKCSFLLNPIWIYNLPLTPFLRNTADDLKETVSWSPALISLGPCTPKQSTASLSNPSSSYCCWQLTSQCLRDWVRVSEEEYRGQPKETLSCPIRQQGVIRETGRLVQKTWGNCLHNLSGKARTPEISISFTHHPHAFFNSLCVHHNNLESYC